MKSRHFSWIAAAAALGLSLVLSATARAEGAGDGEASEDTPQAQLDFRFSAPTFCVGVRGGWAFQRSHGEIYDFLTETLTLDDSDFDSPAFAMDVAVRATSWLDVVLGFDYSGSSNKSEFRNFVDQFGAPIKQKTRLKQLPLTASLKFYPVGRGRQVGEYGWVRATLVPYLGGGIGGTWYELEQKGDFVDFVDLSIFEGKLESDGWAFAQHAFVGFDLKLTRNFGLVLEGRYYWAHADLNGDFVGFDPIDLDGARVMIGLSWRL
jgi:opacity protein-like surface antigen